MQTLTDEQIDQLSGRELDRAVAASQGRVGDERLKTMGQYDFMPRYSNDIGAAFQLLMEFETEECGFSVECTNGRVEVYSELRMEPLASGPKSDAASLFCRAFLKLKNRGE